MLSYSLCYAYLAYRLAFFFLDLRQVSNAIAIAWFRGLPDLTSAEIFLLLPLLEQAFLPLTSGILTTFIVILTTLW